MSEKRTAVEHAMRMAEADIKFFADKVDSELRWLEGSILDLRRAMDRGTLFEQRNLASKAVDVVEASGKLRAAHERLGILKDIAEAELTS